MAEKGCCTPSAPGLSCTERPAGVRVRADLSAATGRHLRDCVPVPGGKAQVGTARPLIVADGEGNLRHGKVAPLWWERGATSVAQFREFVAATGHVTIAEALGWSYVFHSHVPGGAEGTMGVQGLEWWRRVDGASWHHPAGPDGPHARDDMPATHLGWDDAVAFAAWAGGRLPREIEWEHAARGGLGDVHYPWGDRHPDDREHLPCNIWQGRFPDIDTGADGWKGPAPVLAFAPNGYGLHQVVGNVWEWTAEPFRIRSAGVAARRANAASRGTRLLKGGSFLCHETYCHRYRIAARTGNTPDSTSSHTGFRVVYDRPPT